MEHGPHTRITLRASLGFATGITLALLTGGCLSWPHGWETDVPVQPDETGTTAEETHSPRVATPDKPALFRTNLENRLASATRVLHTDADYKTAQLHASQLNLLLGAGFAADKREQRHFYLRALQHAERSLYTVPAFRARIAAGDPVHVAGRALRPDEYEPLFLWSTSILYLFRDVLSLPEKVFSAQHLRHARDALASMLEGDRAWQDGVLPFSMGIYKLSVPEYMGGDRSEARKLMDEAVGMADRRILPRWGRAKYLAVALGNRDLFESDLTWVITRDPLAMDGPLIWNLYFQHDARALLDSVEDYF